MLLGELSMTVLSEYCDIDPGLTVTDEIWPEDLTQLML